MRCWFDFVFAKTHSDIVLNRVKTKVLAFLPPTSVEAFTVFESKLQAMSATDNVAVRLDGSSLQEEQY